jgi:hypothetical protein
MRSAAALGPAHLAHFQALLPLPVRSQYKLYCALRSDLQSHNLLPRRAVEAAAITPWQCSLPHHTAVTAAGGYMRTGTGTEVEAHPETPRFFVTGACEWLAGAWRTRHLLCVSLWQQHLQVIHDADEAVACVCRRPDWPGVPAIPQDKVSMDAAVQLYIRTCGRASSTAYV